MHLCQFFSFWQQLVDILGVVLVRLPYYFRVGHGCASGLWWISGIWRRLSGFDVLMIVAYMSREEKARRDEYLQDDADGLWYDPRLDLRLKQKFGALTLDMGKLLLHRSCHGRE